MRDVARAAGVSPKTVSNVVNEYVHVRPEMRALVQHHVEALGYRPHAVGRQLRHGRTGAIALAVPGVDMPYFADLAALLVRAARDRGLTVVVEQTDGDVEREREVAAGSPVRFADALIFSPLTMPPSELAARHDTPMVLLGEHGAAVAGADRVAIDSVAIGALATAHLAATGRRRIAMVGHKELPKSAMEQRVLGYTRGLDEAGLPVDAALIRTVPGWDRRHGADATDALLAQRPDVDAVFAANDVLAIGVLRALHRHGRRVPDDVAVVGVDDVPESRFTTPALTTVAIDRAFVAEAALELATSRLAEPDLPPRSRTAPHRLVVREST
ncbi:LacI family DNA-binding transcriptional regulator [Pseudonocardia humida]|uniref:LacI family DNA-binding transcriptional regulator n=1 Tax=Pseudonocardia humida TaxID=2800819 RepID=A0ABT0ZXG3_9PSEU|nr:LacI family DNA-binding transcriptional regulator [Pseudonocardia humida]MCO1655433.1 LacI family DNA-binding transcriptional regulator [Pseudonocardia humida]